MTINLDVVLDTPEYSVDMKSGLDTLQGISDAVRLVSETLVAEHCPQRLSHKGCVRTNLKRTFSGSYGHIFSVDFYSTVATARFKAIGREVFCELLSYFLNEAIYNDHSPLSDKASRALGRLGDVSDDLISQLRVSALENIHSISIKFDYGVKVRHRKSVSEQRILASFDKETAEVLKAKESDETIEVFAAITRLNINTGNGRFLIRGEEETVAFGFSVKYRAVRLAAKKLFSENLDHNNGIDQDDWDFLKLSVSPIELMDGTVVKYIIKGISR